MIPSIPPVRVDLFSVFILLGWVQGLILAYFFISHYKGRHLPNLYLGILVLGLSLVTCDVWLGYTNLMFQVVWLNDSTESLNLLMAPMAFLYIKTSVDQTPGKRPWLHVIPAAFYFLYGCLLIFPQSQAFKLHSYIHSFHPDMPDVTYTSYGQRWMYFLKWHINDLTLVSFVAYNVAMFIFLKKAFKARELSFFSIERSALSWYRDIYFQLLLLVVIFCITRVSFPHDLGDHIIAAFIAFVIYMIGFTALKKSLFFQIASQKQPKKYEKSSLTAEMQTGVLTRLNEIMLAEKPFVNPTFSMPALAKRLGVSTHHLSQIINEELGQSFFDLLAGYRVREAQELLKNSENSFIKIEEIAMMVGYNSKSAFNTAFRRISGCTPSEYRKRVQEL